MFFLILIAFIAHMSLFLDDRLQVKEEGDRDAVMSRNA
jgi:hypothetical protein